MYDIVIVQACPLNVRSVIATLNKAHLIVHSSYLPDLQHGHWIELNLKILVFSS